MARYHINFEGKIYPCKAKIYKCPYGEEFHADSQEALYYKLMSTHGTDTEPSTLAVAEIKRTNRLKSLFSMSQAIAQVDYPVDVVVSSLKEALNKLEDPNTKLDVSRWKKFEQDSIEDIRKAFLNGVNRFPDYVPEDFIKRGRRLFVEKDKGKVLEEANKADELRRQKSITTRIANRRGEYKDYLSHQTMVNYRNYESSYAWISHDFEKFSHDLNTSKMITQPMFFGSIERSKETIRNMDSYELLAIYDDYSVTDREIERAVKKSNYFKYEPREDLTDSANKSMETWYNRNREIYEKWKVNTPKRILLSMEIANELDRRGVLRQDLAVEQMLNQRSN